MALHKNIPVILYKLLARTYAFTHTHARTAFNEQRQVISAALHIMLPHTKLQITERRQTLHRVP
jgi:hypothetical protein